MPSVAGSISQPAFEDAAAADQQIAIRELIADEFSEAERLWYQVYVQEMNRTQAYTDHAVKRLRDPFQISGSILGAFSIGRLVGTVRVNYSSSTPLGYYEDLYGMRAFGPDHPARTAVVTRIIVSKDYRSSTIAIRLAANMFKKLCDENVRWILCDCNEGVLNFFLRLGFAVHRYDAAHPDYGPVTILKIDADDGRYRDPRRSLLARFAY